jgi:glycosyltransferase involved in cell wall biosynthesis
VIAAGFKKILLVNDGSSDNTLEILEQKKAEYPQALIIIASHTINRGGGAANQTGYNFVKKYGEKLGIKRFVGFDADGQMDVKDMQKFMQAINQHKTDIYL